MNIGPWLSCSIDSEPLTVGHQLGLATSFKVIPTTDSFYLTYTLTVDLGLYLTFYLAYFLIFYLADYQTFYVTL